MAPIHDIEHMTSLGGLKRDLFETSSGSKIFAYHRKIRGGNNSKIILVLIHGYPQT